VIVIYVATCDEPSHSFGKQYVGQTTQKLKLRIQSHHIERLQGATVLATADDQDEACDLEATWIMILDTMRPNGLNSLRGGSRQGLKRTVSARYPPNNRGRVTLR